MDFDRRYIHLKTANEIVESEKNFSGQAGNWYKFQVFFRQDFAQHEQQPSRHKNVQTPTHS
jgi:hypothetical protein